MCCHLCLMMSQADELIGSCLLCVSLVSAQQAAVGLEEPLWGLQAHSLPIDELQQRRSALVRIVVWLTSSHLLLLLSGCQPSSAADDAASTHLQLLSVRLRWSTSADQAVGGEFSQVPQLESTSVLPLAFDVADMISLGTGTAYVLTHSGQVLALRESGQGDAEITGADGSLQLAAFEHPCSKLLVHEALQVRT